MSRQSMPDQAGGHGRRDSHGKGRLLRRGPWEDASALVIGLGLFMLMQPIAMDLYTWSFPVILIGTVGFLISSHFPE